MAASNCGVVVWNGDVRPWVKVLANAEASGHPVSNGEAAAAAMGAEFYHAGSFDEAATTWPGLIADFVARVAVKEGVKLSPDKVGTLPPTQAKPTMEEAESVVHAPAGVFGNLAPGLTLSSADVLRSSQVCKGDHSVFPEMLEPCAAYKVGSEGEMPYVDEGTSAWTQAWLDNPKDPAVELYRKSGLSVGECMEVGKVSAKPFVKFGDLVGF